ncbi:general secretion pathway protein GspB [Massilia sp. IC2-477]|uniref:general secretion pathway protein GspB n=1 Tax=Massilia sp. IC2-477 TaxID=2887198 RepID=UPI001D0F68A8|nr:general secretion pathway protein GspB [Massilia sp. IC2-477]MCC2954509.1 general secretion pathway protein GspB [Massilia sp. IC2-477]
MSYILEALKKAQAERQLGNAPTIHAPAPSYTAPVTRSSRNPLIVGLVAGTLVVALGALFLLRQPASAPAPAAVVAQAAPAPAPVQAPAPLAAPPAPAPMPAPVAPAKPVEAVKPKPAPPPVKPAPRPEPVEAVPEAPSRPVLVAAAPAPEDNVGTLQSLPDAVQREIPKVSFGGYIYSPNPAERLLLVDKMLRREGEEVAPGLVLERLLPKAAIMNFRGYRYRVGY